MGRPKRSTGATTAKEDKTSGVASGGTSKRGAAAENKAASTTSGALASAGLKVTSPSTSSSTPTTAKGRAASRKSTAKTKTTKNAKNTTSAAASSSSSSSPSTTPAVNNASKPSSKSTTASKPSSSTTTTTTTPKAKSSSSSTTTTTKSSGKKAAVKSSSSSKTGVTDSGARTRFRNEAGQVITILDAHRRAQRAQAALDALERDPTEDTHGTWFSIEEDPLFDGEGAKRDRKKAFATKFKRAAKASAHMYSGRVIRHRFDSRLTSMLNESRALEPASYLNALTNPSRLPRRSWCSVCGNHSPYTCRICGTRWCSSKCLKTHEDTRCIRKVS